MAIAMLFDIPGMTPAEYDRLHAVARPGIRPPARLLYHVAGPSATGWVVVEVWESQEAVDRFFRERLGAALQEAGVAITGPPQIVPVRNTTQA